MTGTAIIFTAKQLWQYCNYLRYRTNHELPKETYSSFTRGLKAACDMSHFRSHQFPKELWEAVRALDLVVIACY